jgi:hypothetical protein
MKFIGMLVLLFLTFGLGYYLGQHPTSTLKNTITGLSHGLLETTAGVERSFRAHQGLVDAKAQMTQAKVELFDRNYGNAAKALGEAITDLERVRETEKPARVGHLNGLIAKIREAQQELRAGKMVTRARLDDIQREFEALAGD